MWHSDYIVTNNKFLPMSQCLTTLRERKHFLILKNFFQYFSVYPLSLILLHLRRVWFCLLYTFLLCVYIHQYPWAFSSPDSIVPALSASPCMRDVSHPKWSPGPFCGLGLVCACLVCTREPRPGPSTQDVSHQCQSPSCSWHVWKWFLELFAPLSSQGLRWGWLSCGWSSYFLLFFSYMSSYVLEEAPKYLRDICFLTAKE